jgi:hypothetical protein
MWVIAKRRWLRHGLVVSSMVAACEFQHGELPQKPSDGGIDAPPDAGMCLTQSSECLGDIKRDCAGPGATATDTFCGWGCVTAPMVHCLQLQPSGNGGNVASGAAPADVVADPMLADLTFGAGILIDGDSGKIGPLANANMYRGSGGTGVINGIDFERRGAVAVFRFKSLKIDGDISLIGSKAIALIADGEIDINNIIDARGGCGLGVLAGPGGRNGGANNGGDAAGSGGGSGSDTNGLGGGGGGNGGSGGDGGGGQLGGSAFGAGDLAISILTGGGGGGGGGGGAMSGSGGGGGGALQVISNRTIAIAATGGINAGGCGGQNGAASGDAGGGGGAGGTILLESPLVTLVGKLAVNGGAGGGGAAGNNTFAPAGTLDRTPAPGVQSGGIGGDGGAAAMLDGSPGQQNAGHGGGGGGAVGRIRVNTRNGSGLTLDPGAVLSPSFDDANTTATKGSAAVQ